MSDLSGEMAFDNVLDRLLDKAEQLSAASNRTVEAERRVRELERELKIVRNELALLNAAANLRPPNPDGTADTGIPF